MMRKERQDTDVALIFGGRTWKQHNALRGQNWQHVRSRPCMCVVEGCKERWLECWGPMNAPYLKRIGIATESAKCGMTPEHAGAQAIVATILDSGKALRFKKSCITCAKVCTARIKLLHGEECRQEAFFRSERRNFADLGIVPKGAANGTRPSCIIEILHSSATLEKHRPNDIPWFEIKAVDVNSLSGSLAVDTLQEFEFDCQRKIECEQCVWLQTFCDWIKEHIPNYEKLKKCILCEEPRSRPFKNRCNDKYAIGCLCNTHSVIFAKYVDDVKMKLSEANTAELFFAGAKVLYHKRMAEAKRVAEEEAKQVAEEEAKQVAEEEARQMEHTIRAERAKLFRQSIVAKKASQREKTAKRKARRMHKSIKVKRNCTKWMYAPVVTPCAITAPQTALYSAFLQLGKITPEQHTSGFYNMQCTDF
jgi:hypothetical protein